MVGYVDDGNFQIGYLNDPHKPEKHDTAQRLNTQLVQRALKRGTTFTGEDAESMVRTIKQVLDPGNIMNPGQSFTTNKIASHPY